MTDTDICANRHGGNQQSEEAFANIVDALPRRRQQVYAFILECGQNGATAQECADHFEVGIHQVSGRLSELKKDEHIRVTGTRGGGGVCVATVILQAEVSTNNLAKAA